MTYEYDAIVVGSGPNGLSAAIRLVQHGLSTLVLEGSSTFGGGVRTEELTLPGFRNDLGSAVHPFAFASPYFSSLGLENHGLTWIFPEIPLAHTLANGRAVALERSVEMTSSALGSDAKRYRSLFAPLVSESSKLVREFLQPLLHLPRYPLTLGLFGVKAIQPATLLARTVFSESNARALLAGLAAHSFLPLSCPGSAAFGLVLGMLGHTTGWPFPQGGANRITSALISCFQKQGGKIQSGFWTTNLRELPPSKLVLLDSTPKQFLQIAGEQMPKRYRDALKRFRYGPGIFKVDYALSKPIPWKNEICR
ncbi:MAG: NAD(P)/FAD-dependent oxidoreductase, partial [Verrucomicrobia bacterium]|nr:NAD(P)/FAD-dependent oxidoreductase [Verrucomicrobiota bacterium]